jgi:hypothetical protein
VELFGFGVTIPAKYRLISTGLKGHFCLDAALSTGSRIHLARASVGIAALSSKTLGSSSRTARRAASGFISKAFAGEEFLFSGREGERFSAIGTKKGFFGVSH